jgi:hypothetical protein
MNIEAIQKDLTSVMSEINTAKGSLSKLEGQEFEILRQMKDKLDLSSVEAANKEVVRIEKLLVKKSEEIDLDYKELKTSYDW